MRPAEAPLPYRLVRSRRRSVAIVVQGDTVEVRAPNRAPLYWINAFVAEKKSWIEKRLAEEAVRQAECWRIADGEQLPFLGKLHRVRIEMATRNHVTMEGGQLTLHCRSPEPAAWHRLFCRWVTEQARSAIPPLATQMASQLAVADRLHEVRFRHTRSKWGHCTAKGVLQFHPLIMLAPVSAMHYLVAHEVSHLVHLNHSADYWDCVAQLCPDHREQRRWLRANEHRFRLQAG